nr:MAG TPA: adenine DNA glycosylase [Caudoviricetes sp.]
MSKACRECPIREICIQALLNKRCPIKTFNKKNKKENRK